MKAKRFFQGPKGCLRRSVTSWSPVASMLSTFENSRLPREPNSPQRFSEATTSAEVMSVPLWKVTPWRRVMTMVRPSSSRRSLSASSGTGELLASKV